MEVSDFTLCVLEHVMVGLNLTVKTEHIIFILLLCVNKQHTSFSTFVRPTCLQNIILLLNLYSAVKVEVNYCLTELKTK